jgi:hypothetical protein
METAGGPSYTPDQLPRPLVMSEGAGCTHGMVTGPSAYYTIPAHMAPDILLERHHLSNPPKTRR